MSHPFTDKGIRPGAFFYGDNLAGLRQMPDNSVRLIYLDPPFNSKKQWSGIVEISHKRVEQNFNDIWTIDDIAQEWVDYINSRDELQPLCEVLEAVRITAGDSAYAYCVFLSIRLIEMKRVLTEDGTIYLHCDQVMSHCIKLVMDALFGIKNFRNEITWKRTNSPKNQSVTFGVQSDSVFVYTKSNNFVFNKTYTDYTEEQKARFNKNDNDGRGPYQTIAIVAGSSQQTEGRKSFMFRGQKQMWLYKLETLEKWWKQGRIYQAKPTSKYRKKEYLKEGKGAPVSDLWIDGEVSCTLTKDEITKYPTQKPEALLKRIILTSTNEGDVVMDPFAGSGTTCAVAEMLNRQRIGMELNNEAAGIHTARLSKVIKSLHKRSKIFIIREQTAGKTYTSHRKELAGASVEYLETATKPLKTEESEARAADLLKQSLQEQHGRCVGCGKWTDDGENFQCDHILPKSKKGLLTKNNTQALCTTCNGGQGKHNRWSMLKVWKQNEEQLQEMRAQRIWRLIDKVVNKIGRNYDEESKVYASQQAKLERQRFNE